MHFWNGFIHAITVGRVTPGDELRALADTLRLCLSVLRERGLLNRTPWLLGYVGDSWCCASGGADRPLASLRKQLAAAWKDTAATPGAAAVPAFTQCLLDLANDALRSVVFDRAEAIAAITEADRSVRPLIHENVRRFIYDRQRSQDPGGNRLYLNVARALDECRAFGELKPCANARGSSNPLDRVWCSPADEAGAPRVLDPEALRARIEEDPRWSSLTDVIRSERAEAPAALRALATRLLNPGEGFRARVFLRVLDGLSRTACVARHAPDACEVVRVVEGDGEVAFVPVAPLADPEVLSLAEVGWCIDRSLRGCRDPHRARVLRALLAHLRESRELPSVDKLLARMRRDGTADCKRTRLAATLRGVLDALRSDLSDLPLAA
jgi:hypothetical protein